MLEKCQFFIFLTMSGETRVWTNCGGGEETAKTRPVFRAPAAVCSFCQGHLCHTKSRATSSINRRNVGDIFFLKMVQYNWTCLWSENCSYYGLSCIFWWEDPLLPWADVFFQWRKWKDLLCTQLFCLARSVLSFECSLSSFFCTFANNICLPVQLLTSSI